MDPVKYTYTSSVVNGQHDEAMKFPRPEDNNITLNMLCESG